MLRHETKEVRGYKMKKRINGKKYDTETADLICSVESGNYGSQAEHFVNRLYKKASGEYFLHTYSENISPLSEESAKEWVMENFAEDEYESSVGRGVIKMEQKTVWDNEETTKDCMRVLNAALKDGPTDIRQWDG